MSKKLHSDDSGLAHLLVVLVVVAVVGLAGFGIMRIVKDSQASKGQEVSQNTEDSAIDQANNDNSSVDQQSDEQVEAGDEEGEE